MLPDAKEAKRRANYALNHKEDHVKDSELYKRALEDAVAGINYASSRGLVSCSIEVNSTSVAAAIMEELRNGKYRVRITDRTIQIYWG